MVLAKKYQSNQSLIFSPPREKPEKRNEKTRKRENPAGNWLKITRLTHYLYNFLFFCLHANKYAYNGHISANANTGGLIWSGD
ncbi:MAG: hypothetical protein ACRCWB_11640 [Enterovibrio sp.]